MFKRWHQSKGQSGDRRPFDRETDDLEKDLRDKNIKGSTSKGVETGDRAVKVQAGSVQLEGMLNVPQGAESLIVFVHGSGSSRHSPRNQFIAKELQQAGLATLLFDLLTAKEEEIDRYTRHLRFDIDLLAQRVIGAADWLGEQPPTGRLKLGLFGASTGAAAALTAAAERTGKVGAVVSRGGRPDLAFKSLPQVEAPTLLIVGELDMQVIPLNERALANMNAGLEKQLVIVPGASHLFKEPGTLEQVARLARDWFTQHLANRPA